MSLYGREEGWRERLTRGTPLAVPTAVILKTLADAFLTREGTTEVSDLIPVSAARSANDNDSMPS